MTTHRPHPIDGEWMGEQYRDPVDAVLFDRCERCDELAEAPATRLSVEYVARLWQRMVQVERHDAGGYRTRAEQQAGRVYYAIALFLERATTVDPWGWATDPWAAPLQDALEQWAADNPDRQEDDDAPAT